MECGDDTINTDIEVDRPNDTIGEIIVNIESKKQTKHKSEANTKQQGSNTNNLEYKLKSNHLAGYEEVSHKYLYHLHGSWIKCEKGNGFLKKVSQDTLVIHDIKEGISEISIDEGPFYVKKTDLNYQYLLWLVKDHEKQIQQEKVKFLDFKNKINNMITNGKLKFTK